MYDLIIKGVLVLEHRVVHGEAGVQDGKIQEISERSGTLQGARTLDFGSCYVFPGMIDAHVHCFSNPEEGFIATTTAAAAGGITTVLDMPYDVPDPITRIDRFLDKRKRVAAEAIVDVGLWASIAKSGGIDQIAPMAEAGAIAFKMSTFETDAYRFPSIPDSDIIKAMEKLETLGLRAAFHAENSELIHEAIRERQTQGRKHNRSHSDTRPPVTETSAVLKVLEFAYWTGVKLHIVHASHPRSIELISLFRKMGVDVTVEICFPHLLLDAGALDRLGPKAKINPPLREPQDVSGLWEKLCGGQVDMIASDHAPWGAIRKAIGSGDIFRAASGMPGVEFMVPLLFDQCIVRRGISAVQFARWLSGGPAETYRIPGKGRIASGYDADFTVIDSAAPWKIDETRLRSHSRLTPFHGYEGKGRVVHTIVRGTSVFNGEEVLVQPGFGQFVAGQAMKKEVLL
ncbi:hypothetical protein EBB07_07790 [Paenibacillaceae bacterium]|nr:hypothetical protein EBB07_07790 [Paenibacillaceae bacterium]